MLKCTVNFDYAYIDFIFVRSMRGAMERGNECVERGEGEKGRKLPIRRGYVDMPGRRDYSCISFAALPLLLSQKSNRQTCQYYAVWGIVRIQLLDSLVPV